MTRQEQTQELEINGMETTSSLPAKPDELADIEPILAEVKNQQTGEFEKVMISPHDIRTYICPTATLPELYIFMSICRHQGIDPISEAYFVKFGGEPGFTVMKYTVYLKRAMQSGILKSIRHEFDDEENPTKIMVYIQRTDMEGEWVWTTYRSEVEKRRGSDNKVTKIWDQQLRFMMTKCGYSQGLRFFCADVVGALPPTQEEMPGIGALNMQSPMTGLSTGELTGLTEREGEAITGEVLEVKSVEPLPEHLDMGPLRIAFHELIAGKFADDDVRHKWQMQHTGIASMKEWGPAEYAKAFKALSKEVGSPTPNQAQDPVSQPQPAQAEGEQEDPQDNIDFGTAEDRAADKEATDDAGPSNTQEGGEEARDAAESSEQADSGSAEEPFLITKETKLKLGALILQFEGYPFGKTIKTNKFKTKAIEITSAEYEDTDAMLESDGILVLNALNTELVESQGEVVDPDPLNQGDHDVELIEIYLEKALLRFKDRSERRIWELANKLPPVPASVWKPDELKRGIAMLEGVTPLAEIPGNADKMSQEQFDRIKAAVDVLPYKHIGSEKFRSRVVEILEVPYGRIRDYSVEQAGDLVHQFEDEVQDYENKRGRYAPAVS